MNQNYRKALAIAQKNKQKLLAVNPELTEESGIYFLTRTDENGIRYAYIGQAKRILSRLAQHLSGYQHIDLSLKKHGLLTQWNPHGWNIAFALYPVGLLDEMEQKHIKQYAEKGYQLRNKTAGGQGVGKVRIDSYKASKGYYDGLKQGYKNASKEVSYLFEKHLNVSVKSDKPNRLQEKALAKFIEFMEYHKEGEV